ncbi:MAG: hypothetical protein LBE01_01795 [Deltaproteobacteria bacterium]|jgi:hypothetical protein|nr:hypothetical protein [Deltaproteobacteria bacterium]
MKIDAQQAYNVFLRPQEAQAQAQSTASATAASEFAALLGQGAKAQAPSLEELGSSLLPKFDLVGQLQASQATKASSNSSPYGAAEDIESLLDLLDNYAQALANPQKALKDLAPLADDLELAAQGLGQTSENLSSDDPLKALTSDTASVAMVEAMKFKRGDYI